MSRQEFIILDKKYGKSSVKLLHVVQKDEKYHILEYEVNTYLTLASDIDYTLGDNTHIIATDSQKNTIYLLAKQHGVKSPEDFALLLATHFLSTYSQNVIKVFVEVNEVQSWKRVHGVHSHAFLSNDKMKRGASVIQEINSSPLLSGHLKDMLLLKTTQSSFSHFIQDDFRTLPDAEDRIFSTSIDLSWTYTSLALSSIDFDLLYSKIVTSVLDDFCGDVHSGVKSNSAQNTCYNILRTLLETHGNEIDELWIRMPNKHYFTVDLSVFPSKIGGTPENKEIYFPIDKPSGMIELKLGRK